MKDILIATVTLGFIFSLFFYYKVVNPSEDNIVSTITSTNSVEEFVQEVVEKENNITKTEKNATKTKADQESEPKQPITDQSLSKDKVAKSKDNQNEKLLPWEDIIPPRK